MYELVIECLVCGASLSMSHLKEAPIVSDADVLKQAKHSPGCALARSGKGIVEKSTRADEPHVIIYSIKGR